MSYTTPDIADTVIELLKGDGYTVHGKDPDGDEIIRCIETALARAHRPPAEIGYVNYHGTSTQLNDAIESRCVRRVFGKHADSVPGSSTKSMIGHPQGASGAAGVAATALALARGVLPPTINLENPDEDVGGLDLVPHEARNRSLTYVLSNSFGFGGTNASLVFSKFS